MIVLGGVMGCGVVESETPAEKETKAKGNEVYEKESEGRRVGLLKRFGENS